MFKVLHATRRLLYGPNLCELSDPEFNPIGASSDSNLTFMSSEVQRIKQSWALLKQKYNNNVGCEWFKLIFEKCPDILACFGLHPRMNVDEAMRDKKLYIHSLVVQDTIDMIVYDLRTDNSQLRCQLITFGDQHAFYTRRRFDSAYLTVFGQCLLLLIDQLPLGAALNRWKTRRLWKRFLFFILNCMQIGYTLRKTKCMVQHRNDSIPGKGNRGPTKKMNEGAKESCSSVQLHRIWDQSQAHENNNDTGIPGPLASLVTLTLPVGGGRAKSVAGTRSDDDNFIEITADNHTVG